MRWTRSEWTRRRRRAVTRQRATADGRRGFTLIELVIALLLADVALLALAGTVALVTRELGEAGARRAAVAIARARLERLASMECPDAVGDDSVIAPGFHEWWSTADASVSTRLLTDSVQFATRRGTRTVALRTRTSC